MDTQEVKIFRDNVHGYIEIPVEYVTSFVDTEVFQRLRHIEQTSMRVLYPSARHDRFIHSLGTYYLGHKAFNCLRKNVKSTYGTHKKDHYYIYEDEIRTEKFWDKYGILFEIACLLHDCGHAPFSHTLEFHYDKEPVSDDNSLKDQLLTFNGSNEFKNDFKGHGSPHERMSALLVCSDFKNIIDEIIKKHNLSEIDEECSNVEFIVRAIIGCRYTNTSIRKNQIKNCLIELLNSKSIDVDSLDYIVRDSKLSGVDNMNIDIERLLGSLTLVEITQCKNSEMYGKSISANIVEGIISSKSNTEKAQIKGRLKGKAVTHKMFEGYISGYVNMKGNFRTQKETTVLPDEEDAIISANAVEYDKKLPQNQNMVSIVLKGIIDKLEFEGSELNLEIDTNSKLDIKCLELCFNSAFINGTITGLFTGILLGNYKEIDNSAVECRLGFHKSSLSVIQNVVIARNYEYQWIYSHHKVVYYSNYLIIDLLRKCTEYLFSKSLSKYGSSDNILAEIFSWKHMINNVNENNTFELEDIGIYRPTDADIQVIFKKCYLNLIKEKDYKNDLYSLLEEYYSRRYKNSLWKSYAEFNTFLRDFTSAERKKIFEKLVENSSYKLMNQYGYLSEDWSKEIERFGLKNVVWVNGDSKLKNLNPDSTFIWFKDGVLTYRSISSNNEIKPITTLDLFYLYYTPINEIINKDGLIDFIKSKI